MDGGAWTRRAWTRWISAGSLSLGLGCATDGAGGSDGLAGSGCDTPVMWFYDADGDGFGAAAGEPAGCTPPPGYVLRDGDCDDFLPDVFPGAREVCGDGIDQDCDGGDAACEGPPEQWWIRGTGDQGLGTELAAAGDLTGDGVADLVAAGPKADAGAGAVVVLAGPLIPGESPAPTATFSGPLMGRFGTAVVALGDVSGDGIDDLAWGAPGDGMLGDGAGRVWLGWGPTQGHSDSGMGSGLVAGDNGVWGVGEALAAGGDVTGDGVADLLVGAPQGGDWATYPGLAFVVPLPLPTDHVPTVGEDAHRLEGADSADLFGASLSVVPDRDGDGLAEVAVGAPSHGGSQGAVYLWHGPVTADQLADDADERRLGAVAGARAGEVVAGADLDADGYAELLVGAPSAAGGRVDVYAADDAHHALVADGGGTDVGVSLDVGDLDGDGWLDLVVGAPADADQRGVVAVWWGPISGTRSWSELDDRLEGEEAAAGLGTAVSVHPDLTGDGLPELVVGAPEASGGAGALLIVSGTVWGPGD